MSWGTLRWPGGIFWSIHTETKPSSIYIEIEYYMYNNKLYDALMKINIQINKKMIKMNKQKYFDVSFRYSRASWGVLGFLWVSWGNKTDPMCGYPTAEQRL